MQVSIGVPYHRNVEPETLHSLLHALQDFPHKLHYIIRGSCYLDRNREQIAQEALEAGSDRLVLIDTDMAFQADGIRRLLKHSYPIVGGAYNERRFDDAGRPVSTVKLPDGKGGIFVGQTTFPKQPFQAYAVATGFLSIHLPTVKARMTRPWFEYDHRDLAFMGEDVYFCFKARQAGLPIWCDPTIPLRHMGSYPY